MSAPSKYKKYFPIVENRYDDFVALHVNMTEQCKNRDDYQFIMQSLRWSLASVSWTNPDGTIGGLTPAHPSGHEADGLSPPLFEHDDVHGSGSILPWHRYAVTVYEDALVNECGWTGGAPCEFNIVSLQSSLMT